VAEPPEIQYVNCGGRDLAYEVIGSGTAGFVYLECGAHLDLMWTDPAWRQQAERFGELWRAAFFQMRGIGQSEPVERLPTLEELAQDIATVMDAVGLERAWVYGSGATAAGAVVFAATHPDRVDGLVLLVPFLSAPLADDPDLTGWEPGAARRWAEAWLEAAERWGTGVMVDGWDPAVASKSVYRQAALLERTSASRAVARAYIETAMRTDVSRIAGQVQCPVRVLHNPTNPVPEAVSRHAAELFPAGELVVLRPSEPGMSWGETFDPVWEHNAELVSGRAAPRSDRLMATVMFEDVVGSTNLISEIGDDAWGRLTVKRDRLVRDCVEDHAGEVVHKAGDGSMCTLPGPAVALRCAEQLHELVGTLELELRVGIHTGECERIRPGRPGGPRRREDRRGRRARRDAGLQDGERPRRQRRPQLRHTRDPPAEGSARRPGAARGHRQHNPAQRSSRASQAATERPAHRYGGAPDAARHERRQPPGLRSLGRPS
jgi:pimeloyl-ACP methyl ester carboxylesterase